MNTICRKQMLEMLERVIQKMEGKKMKLKKNKTIQLVLINNGFSGCNIMFYIQLGIYKDTAVVRLPS